MKMDELIDELNGWGEEVPIGLSMLIGKLVDCALARDAERTTLVTPEWLDGPEGRRLGFEYRNNSIWWAWRGEGCGVGVGVCLSAKWFKVTDHRHNDVEVLRDIIPTISQVRDAVRLFTGRE